MASRSGGGMGVTVALVISILLVLVLVLTNMLFYTKKDQAEQELAKLENDYRSVIRPEEVERDEIKRLRSDAGSASVVTYLRNEFKAAMQQVSGNRELDRAGLQSILAAEGLGDTTLLAAYRAERGRADSAEERAQSLEEQLNIAEQRLADFSADLDRMQANHQATIDSLNAEIGRMQARVDDYAQRVENAEQNMENRVSEIRDNYENQLADKNSELEQAKTRIASQQDSIKALQQKLNEIRPTSANEGALADGQILEVLEDGSVFVDLGRQQRAVLGMRFEVYDDVTETRADASGNMPLGKATIEITRVDDNTSMARVIRSSRGRAVVKGDILVNPIYDKNKQYLFYVFGNFDLDGVGGPTEIETETVRSRIREWGGVITDEFRGDIDFLVMGVKPSRPGPLPPNPPAEVVRQYVEAQRFFTQYEDYVAQAGNLSIPVLNQNRLFTLIGYYGP